MKQQWAAPMALVLGLSACGNGAVARPSGDAQADADQTSSFRSDTTINSRRLWSGTEYGGFMAPDGQSVLVSTIDANVGIVDLASGQLRKLTTDGNWDRRAYYAGGFSPNGKEVVYVLEDYEITSGDDATTIIASTDGKTSRKLMRGGKKVDGWVSDWSPDGKWLLMSRTENNAATLRLVSPIDGTERQLKTFDWRGPLHPTFSADGRYILYSFLTSERDINRDLYVIDLQTGREQQISSSPETELAIGMDASHNVYYSTTTKGQGRIWSAPLAAKGLGLPTLIRGDLIGLLDSSIKGGKLFYETGTADFRLQVASIDPRTGAMTQPKVTQRFHDDGTPRLAPVSWSPDGNHIAFPVQRRYHGRTIGQTMGLQSVNTGELREVSLGNAGYISQIQRWDEEGIRFVAYEAGRPRVQIMNVANGTRTILDSVTIARRSWGDSGARTKDGNTEYTIHPQVPAESLKTIIARDLKTGSHRVVYSTRRRIGSVALSPDERSLAFVVASQRDSISTIEVMPIDGGMPRVIMSLPKPDRIVFAPWFSLPWTASNHIFYVKGIADTEAREIWRLPASGGTPERVWVAEPGLAMGGLRLSPDRRRIAFMSNLPGNAGNWSVRKKTEFWVLEGLVSK